MSFVVEIMKNNSDDNKIGKYKSTVLSLSGTLKDATSVIDPTILVEGDLGTISKANYMHISAFGRYYFITDIRSVRNGLVEITAHVDVLESYASEIKANTAIVARQENKWNLLLDDGVFKAYNNPQILTLNFPSGFTKHEFVLAVAGG